MLKIEAKSCIFKCENILSYPVAQVLQTHLLGLHFTQVRTTRSGLLLYHCIFVKDSYILFIHCICPVFGMAS